MCSDQVLQFGWVVMGQGVRDKPYLAQHVARAPWLAAVPTDVESTAINLGVFKCISNVFRMG
jgi:hypothetical protein